jgi:pimeloyl-ACP methyl ester carboxylesterase
MTIEALLLIPPILCDARVFEPQITALSQDGTVQLAYTKEGERIEEIASQILDNAPQRFALAGMGMGGTIALEIFRRAPERVLRIALLATNVQSDSPDVAAMREPLIIAARAGRLNDVVESELMPAHLEPTAHRLAITHVLQNMAADFGMSAYVKQVRAMQRRKDQQDILRKIKVPALVLCGENDVVNTLRRHEFVAQMIPYAKLEVISEAAHLPTLEQSAAVTQALRTWMTAPLLLR